MSEQEVPSDVTQRIIIKFLAQEGLIPPEILTRLRVRFKEECLSQARVYSWAKSAREAARNLENGETVSKMNLALGDQDLLSFLSFCCSSVMFLRFSP